MNSIINHSLISALILSVSPQFSAFSQNDAIPEIDFSNNITEIERLKIDSDLTLMTKFTTEWEVEQDQNDANENGHNLLYHGGYIYTYLDVYNSNPVMRRYNAADPTDNLQHVLPFSDLGVFNGRSLCRHAMAIDENGKFIFVFGLQSAQTSKQGELFIVIYDFETNSVTASRKIALSEKINMNATNLSFAKVTMDGDVDGTFTLTTLLATSNGSACNIRPLTISGNDGVFTANLAPYVYQHSTSEPTVVDICQLDENNILVSDLDEENPIMLLTYNSGDFEIVENWTDENTLPKTSTKSEPDAFGLHAVKHNGHTFLVYAHSYKGNVVYNVVKWDDFSSFDNMDHIARINVGSSENVEQIYELGLRQIVIEGPQSPAPSRDNNFYNETAFFTYAPGVKLAKHRVITETDLIYTALDTPRVSPTLTLEGRSLSNPSGETVTIYDSAGKLINATNATIVNLESLPQGFYVAKSANSVTKVIL